MSVKGPRRVMMTIRRKIIVYSGILLFFTCASKLEAQQYQDFQSWWEVQVDKDLSPRLNLNGELEQRFHNNSLKYNRSLVSLGASYDLLDYLKAAGGARTIFILGLEDQMYLRYRLHLDLEAYTDLSGFDFSFRTRLQYGFDELLIIRYFRLNSMVSRNKLKLGYRFFGTKFDCFASAESWHGANNEEQWLTYAMRYALGLRYKLNFRSRFSLRYIMEDEFNVSYPEQLHVLVLGYSYKL